GGPAVECRIAAAAETGPTGLLEHPVGRLAAALGPDAAVQHSALVLEGKPVRLSDFPVEGVGVAPGHAVIEELHRVCVVVEDQIVAVPRGRVRVEPNAGA